MYPPPFLLLNIVDDDEAGAVAIGEQAEGGRAEGEAGDGQGRLIVHPGGQAGQGRLVARWLFNHPWPGLTKWMSGKFGLWLKKMAREQFGRYIAHFWHNYDTLFAHFWHPFCTLLAHFCHTFGTLLTHFSFLTHFWHPFGNLLEPL